MTTRARRPVTLYTVAGLRPVASLRAGECRALHGQETVVGYVAVSWNGGLAQRDVAAYDGPDSFSGAWRASPLPRSVHTVFACGHRTDAALPAKHIEHDAEPCASGDGYLDPGDSDVVCETTGERYHLDCHAAACRSRTCARENDLD